ncbi:hypothetical protein WN55_09028 [Dufourea novaeangliae]|uniref:BZIP domain-containing protein n=2 Tax=Dufourea novaeangliae TaxID=178035 RepID=A0A154P7R5_DUFNO|nr:hypothetical protein WN55_09028 [Dufourea novaeangliae]
MESELLKEPWVFPQSKVNQIKEEEKAASSIWEENFQDLSDWCMDKFQGHCDFHIGESPIFRVSGTKYEGNSALSSAEKGVLQELMSVADKERWNVKMNSAGTTEYSHTNYSLQCTSKISSRSPREDSTVLSNTSNTSNTRLKLSDGETSSTSTSTWNKQNTTDVGIPLQSRYKIESIDLDDCLTSFDSTNNQRETWDVLRTVETTGSDTFDLLSYLCDDEMRSPEGSISTDSSVVSKPWSPAKSIVSPQSCGKVKSEETKSPPIEEYMQSRAASTVTSSAIEKPIACSRKSERIRTAANKVDKAYNRIMRREKQARKRFIETDLEDRTFALHYRESREKNNEASRKSRMNKKAKESEITVKAVELERDNRILKMKVEELEKLVTSMRSALLRSALKKEF